MQQLEDSGYNWYVPMGNLLYTIADNRPKLKSKLETITLTDYTGKAFAIPVERNLAVISSVLPLRRIFTTSSLRERISEYYMEK